ncbi:NfeD family protein [Stygiobacter electus]|uniref:Nodulation protein NfeD n=1 Tax=Stygiobacter electus TaxID=3032292 RepID=A0AAE3NXQ9_9BACT|nr:nodulation protein NfeD [Stygiobacter electus]MDF1610662.1 nodulation protein NfeD [Stygiobacter electus]
MKKYFLLVWFAFILTSNIFAQVIYVGNIEGEIDLGIAPYVKRVIREAEENKAQAIIFRINTFGGRVDAATQIKDAILNSKVKTIAFIDKRAISAGALIALSCEKIIMVPGASMGASTVVDQEGKKQSEKYQSYMRSEMRATAEKNGRRTDIAQAMVDESIVIRDLKDDSTKLVTLTAEEAVKFKMADTILTSLQEVKDYFGFSYAETRSISSNWAEDVVRFLSNPIVSSLLIMIGLIGLFTEIKTPGWGLAGTAGLIALTLFFGTSYILELATIWEIIIFIMGVILLIVEIFVIPGFGITGILGIILMMVALFFGLITDIDIATTNAISIAIIQLASTFVLTAIVIYFIWKFLPKSQTFNKLILDENLKSKSGYTAKPEIENLVGKVGKSITDLRPAGSILIDNQRIDVVTEGDYIEKDNDVIVKKVEGSKVIVIKKK